MGRLVNDYFLIALKDSSKASIVLSISSSLWASEVKPASKGLGAR